MDQSTGSLTDADIAAIAANLRAATGGAAPHQALRLMRELARAAGGGELEAAEATGEMPGELIVLGVQPERIELGMELSPRIAEVLPRVVELALAEAGVESSDG